MSQRYQGTPQGLFLPPGPWGPWGSPKLPMVHKSQIFCMEAFNSESKILTHHQYNWLGPQSHEGLMDFMRPPSCYPRGAWNYQNAINFIQDRGGQRWVLKPLIHFSFFPIFSVFLLSSSLLPPRCSFLLVAPSSKSLFPPCCPFLLVAPSSLALLPLCHSFLCFISFRNVISSNLKKALRMDEQMGGRTDGRTTRQTDGRMDGRSDRRTDGRTGGKIIL